MPPAVPLDGTIVGSVAVQFLDTFNEASERTYARFVVEERRTVRRLLPVRSAKSMVELGFRLAACGALIFLLFPNTAFPEKSWKIRSSRVALAQVLWSEVLAERGGFEPPVGVLAPTTV